MDILFGFLIAINLYGFLVMRKDKQRARRKGRRVSEKRIFITSVLGGAIGVYLAMKIFHHKTRHKAFTYGIPLIILIQILLFVVLLYYTYGGEV